MIACVACASMALISAAAGLSQSCKPDASSRDKITKEVVNEWVQNLYQTGMMAQMTVTTSEVDIFATIARIGSSNTINIVLTKQESNANRALVESAFRAEKGNKFLLGFKDGAPLIFTADNVGNGTSADMFGKLNTKVVLVAHVSDADLSAMRTALTAQPVDAVRIMLSNDLTIEKSVKDNDGKKLQEKFGCFFKYLESQGIDLSKAAKPIEGLAQPTSGNNVDSHGSETASIQGRYADKKDRNTFADFGSDGTVTLHANGGVFSGPYQVTGQVVTIGLLHDTANPQRGIKAGNLRIANGELIDDSGGTVYDKQLGSQSSTGTLLTADQIIQMIQAKLPDDIIIKAIQKAGSNYSFSPEDLIKLKTAGASDAVMRALL
jgi:hypothetical protein